MPAGGQEPAFNPSRLNSRHEDAIFPQYPPPLGSRATVVPNSIGTVPVTWSFSNDFDRSSGSCGSDDRASSTHTATAPKPRGLSPQPSPSVTTLTDLPVPAVLTIAPVPLTPPPPRSRGDCPRNRVLQ
ncbi:MAG UNVERIFIED_CONTAM: hypothetical protein LVR18_13660 [Planctomycetaceae bacterium]